jgi:5-methylcytosine-specific restriction endonuclease McrA
VPSSPPSRCCEPGCHELTAYGMCDNHKRKTPSRGQRPPRNPETEAWGAGSTRRWRRIRAAHLARQPDCVQCGTTADEVDHVVPLSRGGHRWDPDNLQSLCLPCHQAKTAHELGQYNAAVAGRSRVRTYRVDNRVIVVSGSPCAGKTTYVAKRRQLYDVVFDFDAIALALGAPGDQPPHLVPFVCEMRDAFLARLTRRHQAPRVWIITTDPHLAERLIGAQHITVHATRDECMARAVTAHRPHRWVDLIDRWHEEHGTHAHMGSESATHV